MLFQIVVCVLYCFGVISVYGSVIAADSIMPIFPLQFSADIFITAHLIENDSEYPPRNRRMTVYYDYTNKLARADLEGGYEAAKIYIRRYGEKNEYMIRFPPINDCKRSYLGEIMPFPDIPNSFYVGIEVVNGVKCDYFLHEDYNSRIHIYMTPGLVKMPVRLIQEDFENGVSTPLLTYDYSNVNIGPPDNSLFELPNGFEHSSCSRHVGGFPYLHIFHYFVKF